VRTLLREAAQLGLIDAAPRLPPGFLKDAKKLPASPTLAEVEGLVAKSSGWTKIALGLGVYAGLRSGEIRALRAGDVDLDVGIIQVRVGARKTWSVHALRHAFCSHLVRVGIGVEAVRALAGHSSIRVTNRYVHATGADLQGAMERGFRRAVGDREVTGREAGS
jgi:integrase